MSVSARRISQIITIVALLTLAAINHFGQRLTWTGDEPRYTYYAAAFYANQSFQMSDEQWNAFVSRFALPEVTRESIAVVRPTVAHAPLHAVVAAPAVGLFGVDGGRWLLLLIAGLGFLAVLQLLQGHVGPVPAAIAAAFAFLSLPIQPYSRLLYADAPALLLFAVAWRNIHRPQRSLKSLPLTLIPIFLLPFLHLRMATVAVGLFLLWLYRIATDAELRPMRLSLIVTTMVAALVAAGVFAAWQLALFGSLTGGATAPEPLSLTRLPYRLGVQLFEFRHGLLANNPAMLLGFVGLGAAAWRGSRIAREGLLLFVLYLPFVVGAASEAMPARFWVAAMPIFIVGCALWIEQARNIGSWVVAVPLIFVSVLVSGLLAYYPDLFLENRHSSFTYEFLYRKGMGNVYFAPFLPWETYAVLAPHDAENKSIVHAFLAGTAVFAILAGAGLSRRPRVWLTANAAALACVAWFVFHYSARPMGKEQFSTAVNVMPDKRYEVVVTFSTPLSPRVITFGAPRSPWYPPDYPNELQVDAREGQGNAWSPLEAVPTRPIIGLSHRDAVQAIRIVESNPTNGLWTRSPVSLLQ
jgi:hypothetical protein